MTSRTMVEAFMAQKKLALVRASQNAPVRGLSISKELAAKGYAISVVYLEDDLPGSRLRDLKESVGGVIIAVPPNLTENAVREAIEAKIPRVWIQKGSESKSAIQLCEQSKVPVVHGECVMMFADPVKSFHAFHRWIWKTLGKLPK